MRYEVISPVRLFSVRILSVGYSKNPHITRYGPGRRSHTLIHYCTEGKGCFNGHPITKGMGFIIRPGDFEEYYADEKDPWTFLWLFTDGDCTDLLPAFDEDPETHIFTYGYTEGIREIQRELTLTYNRPNPPLYPMQLLLRVLSLHPTATDNRTGIGYTYASHCRNYMEVHLHEHITVENIAKSIGITTSYLYRCFHRAYGISPKQFLSQKRLETAKLLLASGELTVSEIGRAVGYEDVLEFSRFFRTATGYSPSHYQKGT